MNKHILVVEDNPLHGELTQLLLERAGMKVTCCQSVEDALEQTARFDLVLCDVFFQGHTLSGLDFPAEAKARANFEGVPIVAFSAAVLPSEQERARAAGFVAFLTKPFEFDLAERVQELMK